MNNTKYWIALDQSHGIGPANLKEIYNRTREFNLSVTDLVDLNENDLKNEFNFNEKIITAIINLKQIIPRIEKDYFSLLDAGINIIPFFSKKYPEKLFKTMGNSFPPVLYTFGNEDLLNKKGIAILGDSDVSERGKIIAYMGAKQLSRHKIITISGLAAGADIISHRSALENNGETVAFVPYGIFQLKIPPFLEEVFNPDRAVIVSSFYPSAESNKFNAFIRNKLACALSYGVFIVEAPSDGGIFEAAKSAGKLDIPLFTTEYSEYPDNAAGNKKIISEMGGLPVRGKKENEKLVPNMDRIIALAKF